MMEQFGFTLPTEIQFGRGVVSAIAQELSTRGLKKPLIVTDKELTKIGLTKNITDILDKEGVGYKVFDDIVPNPRDYDCDAGAEYAKKENVDSLIAIGGGSAMDSAKAIATLMTNGKTTRDWLDVELDKTSAPVICVPTTCGTGSEVTFNAVITNTETSLKDNIFDPKCAPILALVDPNMIDNLPSNLIASTGMDALTHAVEAYVSTVATPITDIVAIKAVKLISDNILPAAKRDPDAMEQVFYASMLAGIAFGNADTAAVHCIAECFGGYYDIPHGVTNSIFLAPVSEFSISGNPKKYAEIAKAMGIKRSEKNDVELAKEGVEKMRTLAKKLGIPKLNTFKKINPDDFEYLAKASAEHVCNPSNPIKITQEEYLDIFHKVYY